jgi:nitrogen fixation NifU-like protein
VEIDELYQEIILDHSRKPRNYGELDGETTHASGENPSCGDEISVHLKTDGKMIEDIRFTGQGCAISQASASMMTLGVKGKSIDEALALQTSFTDMLTQIDAEAPKVLGNLRILKGVSKFPQRVKCATLAWQALKQAIKNLGNGKSENICCDS